MIQRIAISLLLLLLCVPASWAQEEEPGPITWLAFSKVKPGKTQDAVAHSKLAAQVMTKLMDEGKVLSWGLGTPINHRPGNSWNHVEWVTLPDWTAVGDWANSVMADMQSLAPEEMAARERQAREIYVDGSHFDQVVRHFIFATAEPAAQSNYLYLAHFDANPGQAEAAVALFRDTLEPLVSPLVEQGAIHAYGAYTHELHGAPGSTSHTVWYGLSDLSAIDAMNTRFAESRSPGDMARFAQAVDFDSHYDQVVLVLHEARAAN